MGRTIKDIKQGATVGAVGIEMGVAVAIGYAVGFYLDKWLGTAPWMQVIWTGFGLGAAANAVWRVYLVAKRIGEEPPSEEPGNSR